MESQRARWRVPCARGSNSPDAMSHESSSFPEAEPRFWQFVESPAEGALVLRDGVIVDASASFVGMSGRTRAALVGLDPVSLVAHASRVDALAVVRGEHGGRVRVQALRPDGGDIALELRALDGAWSGSPARVLVFRDPQRDAVPMRNTSTPQPSRPAPQLRGRALVVDDEAPIGALIRRALLSLCEVDCVDDARLALARIEAGARYEVVLSDLNMPVMDGVDFYRALLRAAPEQAARVVFITGGVMDAQTLAFLETVANPVIEKPFDIQRLRAVARERIDLGPLPR